MRCREVIVEERQSGLELIDGVPACCTLLEFDYQQPKLLVTRCGDGEVAHLGQLAGTMRSAVLGFRHIEAESKSALAIGVEPDIETTSLLAKG